MTHLCDLETGYGGRRAPNLVLPRAGDEPRPSLLRSGCAKLYATASRLLKLFHTPVVEPPLVEVALSVVWPDQPAQLAVQGDVEALVGGEDDHAAGVRPPTDAGAADKDLQRRNTSSLMILNSYLNN